MRKFYTTVIIIVIVASGIFLYFFSIRGHKNQTIHRSDWVISRACVNKDISVYTSPRPARKFVRWNGKIFVSTAGGLFPVENTKLAKPLTVADGLPSHDIYDAQLYGSDIILATDRGLAIVEPNYTITQITNPKNSRCNRINALAGSRKIIFATDNGLFDFDGDDVSKIADGKFDRIIEISGGYIITDSAGKIYRLSDEKIAPICAVHTPIHDIAYYDDKIFVATSRGCLKISTKGEIIDTVRTTEPMTTCVKFGSDTLLAAGFYGCDMFVADKKIRTIKIPLRWGGIRDITNYNGEYLLCGDGGVIDESGNSLDDGFLPSNRITAICEFDGEIWVGTFSDGISHFDGDRWEIEHFEFSPFINSLVSDGEALWVGTDDGLVRIAGNIKVFGKRDGLNSDHITALHFDGEHIWVATNRGVCESENFGWRQFYINDGLCGDHTYSIYSKDNDVWIATYGGITEISPVESRCFRRVDGALKNDWATAVIISDDGVFVGTYGGGISRYSNGQWKFYEKGAIVNPNAVALWRGKPVFGTAQNGILIWDGIDFVHFDTKNGLPSDEILSIFADENYIWLGTVDGIAKFSPNI